MAKITDKKKSGREERETIVVRTKERSQRSEQNWWNEKTPKARAEGVIATIDFLRQQQQYRQRQASVHARLYGNIPLANWAGSSLYAQSVKNNLPIDRPTMNVIQSCIDTLVSRLIQSKPRPVFLTENALYKQRRLAKQLTNFSDGELYRTKAYELGEEMLRDAGILGDGVIHIFEQDNKVALERVLETEMYVDQNDGFYGKPRRLYRVKLVDRATLAEVMPEAAEKINQAEQAYPDNSAESQKTISDQIMLVEAWQLPTKEGAKDGIHLIACTSGSLIDESYDKSDFPFVFMPYSRRMVGFWSQGLAEQLVGTQIEINKLLITISKSINLVGVPRVFVEDGSKVVKSHLNNEIGAIVTYRGTKPEYAVAPCVPAELYAQLQRLIDYAYQQSGISALAAASQKPEGLDSGTALREFDDLQSDRFASISKRYNKMFIDLTYKIIDKAKDICKREGKYTTVYPSKDCTQEVDLPKAALLDNPYVIQCFDESSLPRDPAGRAQKIIEYMQAGMLSPEEGRRMLNIPDTEREDKLAMAAKERILKQLDGIVDDGKYVPPDPFTDLAQAAVICVQYYNLYEACGLEENKLEMLRDYHDTVLTLQQASQPQPMPEAASPGGAIGQPAANPQSNLMPIPAQ